MTVKPYDSIFEDGYLTEEYVSSLYEKIELTAKEKEELKANETEKIFNIIAALKGEVFGNKEQRNKMAKMLLAICYSTDPEARKVAKYLGDMMTDYGESSVKEENNKREGKNMRKIYESISNKKRRKTKMEEREEGEFKIILKYVNKEIEPHNYLEGSDSYGRQSIFFNSNLGDFTSFEGVVAYLSKYYGLSESTKDYIAFEKGRISYNQLENDDGFLVTEKDRDYAQFKNGDKDLWLADYDIGVEFAKVYTPDDKEISKMCGIEMY